MRADPLSWNVVSGWHAQGEIPDKAELDNQTMMVTTITEAPK
jgi:hypothetical protein